MQQQYQTCCPPSSTGAKNTSPYCVSLGNKLVAATNNQYNNVNGYSYNAATIPSQAPAPKKPFYQFWGGKKTKMRRNKKQRYSKKYRK
jgi:hypothetical protein